MNSYFMGWVFESQTFSLKEMCSYHQVMPLSHPLRLNVGAVHIFNHKRTMLSLMTCDFAFDTSEWNLNFCPDGNAIRLFGSIFSFAYFLVTIFLRSMASCKSCFMDADC